MLDALDRRIINNLQGGFPICEFPFAEAAFTLGLDEEELMERIERLLEEGVLSRFAPMFNAEKMGGAVTLAAMTVPDSRFDDVAELVNAHDEVAHNYARDHDLNMWFVISSDDPARIDQVISQIQQQTGIVVVNMPKTEEFYIGLRFEL